MNLRSRIKISFCLLLSLRPADMHYLLGTLFFMASVVLATSGRGTHDDLARRVTKPNFVFIMSDDQDVHLKSLDYMKLLRTHMTEDGTHFTKHYCTVAQCCPSQ